MRELAISGSKDLEVREAALDAVMQAGVAPHDKRGELLALFRFVRDRIRFTFDILGVETVQSPRYTLERGAGDCDDRATLLVALARAIGHPTTLRFRVIGTAQSRGRFSHVYVVARIDGRDVALDPTYPQTPIGFEYPRATRMGDFHL